MNSSISHSHRGVAEAMAAYPSLCHMSQLGITLPGAPPCRGQAETRFSLHTDDTTTDLRSFSNDSNKLHIAYDLNLQPHLH